MWGLFKLKLQTYREFLNYGRFLFVAVSFALNNSIVQLVYQLSNSIPFIDEILCQENGNNSATNWKTNLYWNLLRNFDILEDESVVCTQSSILPDSDPHWAPRKACKSVAGTDSSNFAQIFFQLLSDNSHLGDSVSLETF